MKFVSAPQGILLGSIHCLEYTCRDTIPGVARAFGLGQLATIIPSMLSEPELSGAGNDAPFCDSILCVYFNICRACYLSIARC